MLDAIQNHALRLCLGAYRMSPSFSLCVLANEPPPLRMSEEAIYAVLFKAILHYPKSSIQWSL